MLFKDLTKEQREWIQDYYINDPDEYEVKEELHKVIGNRFDVTARTIRNWLREMGLTQSKFRQSISNHPQHISATERDMESDKDVYFITWIQNKTPVHKGLLDNMKEYAEELDAEIVTILGRYRNPTSVWKDVYANEGWETNVSDYHCAQRFSINESLDVLGDIKVRPTAKKPLTGFESISGTNTTIIGHPKLHLKTATLPKEYDEKVILTTGALTYRNYTDSKAGSRGEEKHKFGFAVVEVIDDTKFCVRQVEAEEDGSFQDLWNYVTEGQIIHKPKAKAILFGDTHGRQLDNTVNEINDNLCEIFNPDHTVFHDIIDGESVSYYVDKDPFDSYRRQRDGNHLIQEEIDEMVEYIGEKIENNYGHINVIRSNHDERFDRALARRDWKKDLANAEFYFKYIPIKARGDAPNGVIPYILEERFGDSITTLNEDSSLKIGKYECGMHGHIGLNGARGTKTSFHKIDIPTVTAHGHTTTRLDDTIILGTNTYLDLGYNLGPSSWSQSNAIIYENDILQQILIHNGRYTAQNYNNGQ